MTTNHLREDDLYRTSTQYRLWSFSPEQLAARRRNTHQLAVERVKQYTVHNGEARDSTVIEHLTEEEELRLVQRYCDQIRRTSDNFKWPVNVKATAVQYLKRFYLSNSCMTYPPKEIYKTILYLATKTEAIHVTLSQYVHRISADPDAVLAPEYKVMQALRFTLDVRQPFRGLKGVLMELLNMAAGLTVPVDDDAEKKSGKAIQDALRTLQTPTKSCMTQWRAPTSGKPVDSEQLIDRINLAYTAARNLLDAPALLTDVYFLYTPSQIVLAAMNIADKPLTAHYLDSKLPLSSAARLKALATIHACAAMMENLDAKAIMSKDERDTLEKRLDLCRDPATRDLVKAHAAMKRNGAEDGKIGEQDAKRRKIEREKSNREMDDLFGPSLTTNKPEG